jgi:hypothetical protein
VFERIENGENKGFKGNQFIIPNVLQCGQLKTNRLWRVWLINRYYSGTRQENSQIRLKTPFCRFYSLGQVSKFAKIRHFWHLPE